MTGDSKGTVMMGTCPVELEKHLILDSDRFVTHPQVKADIRDYVEQMCHKTGSMELGEIAPLTDDDGEGEWGEAQTVGRAKGKGKGKGNLQGPPERRRQSCARTGAKGRRAGRGDKTIPTTFCTTAVIAEKGPQGDARCKARGKRRG